MDIETKIAIETENLFSAYFPYYKEHYNGCRNRKSLEPQRKYFKNAAMKFCVRDNYNAEKLIQAFVADGFKYPAQLPNEYVWNTYINYLPGLQNKKSKEIELVEQIANGATELKKYGTVQNWLSKKINQRTVEIKKMKFVPTLFAFSESFNDFCRGDYYNLNALRSEIYNCEHSEKILSKVKDLLGDDYISD